jgi:hypothetical protein
MWFQIPKSLKKIPVVGKGLESLNDVGITKRTMDVVFMGSPLQLSIGPYVSVPVSYVLKYQPKFSAVVNWAFPYGPSTDVNLFFPTWLKRLTEQKMGVKDTSYANDFGLIMQTEYRKAREAKLPYPSDAEIKKKVDAFYSMRIWASLILPVTPQFESPFRLHIEKYRIYVEKYGLEAPGKFFEDYRNKLIIDELKKHNLKYVYYGGVNIKDTPFVDYVEVGLDFAKVTTPLRVQLYIRSKAKINIGYQSSIYELICRYSPIVCTEMDGGPRENYFDNITYLK